MSIDAAAVAFTVNAHATAGHKSLRSGQIMEHSAPHSDVGIPFASLDPHGGPA
jgi:uncharacterized protein